MRASSLIAFIAVTSACHTGDPSADSVAGAATPAPVSLAMFSDPTPPGPIELHHRQDEVAPEPEASDTEPQLPLIPKCSPDDGERHPFTAAQREETRVRVQRTCKALEASPVICAYMDAIVIRESSGNAGVRHHKGTDADGVREDGLGAMGLSKRWHHDKWPGRDEDPMFCAPEVSAVVAHTIFWRAMDRFQADTVPDIQSIYGGHWKCHKDPDTGLRVGCFPSRDYSPQSPMCARMRARGFNCYQPIRTEDLGKRIAFKDRRAFALGLMKSWEDEHRGDPAE
jgi:hypothetical protein